MLPCAGTKITEEEKEIPLAPMPLSDEKNRSTERIMTCATPVFGENQDNQATIRLLVVYTQEALNWSNASEGGIANTIASGVARTQTVWNNNTLGATIELTHAELVDYPESGDMSTDLNRLYEESEGYLGQVHQLRKMQIFRHESRC